MAILDGKKIGDIVEIKGKLYKVEKGNNCKNVCY